MSNLNHYIIVPNVSIEFKKRIEKLLRSTHNLKDYAKTGSPTTATLDDRHFCFYHSIYIPSESFKGFYFKIL